MGEKIVVGPVSHGLRNDVTPFNIDNDSFPTLINAYQWRGRVKRKRGTSPLTRLRRFFNSTNPSFNPGGFTLTLDGAGAGNILSGFGLEANSSITPGTVEITGGVTYTDPAMDGTLSPSGTINYSTGVIVIAAEAGAIVTVQFNYYPSLPVMGFEDLLILSTQFPGNLAFDTVYSYNVLTTFPYTAYNVSFYKNPATDAINLPGYIPKTNWTPLTWNGQNYQQFWSTNYQNALWVTNGVNVPFSVTNVGMQYKFISAPGVAITTAGNGTTTPAVADITVTAHGLVIGDFVFINEVNGITGINFQTGYVTAVPDANTITVTFPFAILGGAYVSAGIVQYLTNRSDVTKDCIRWYDGDPTDGVVNNPGFLQGKGWVNFCPPLSESNFSIADLPAAQYYLAGARMILEFKDRILFLGAVVQTSAAGSQVYLKDTIVYSQNGTPYYTASYFNTPNAAIDTPTSATNLFNPILLPENQTATSPAFFEDQTGFGGFASAGLEQTLTTAASNEDVLIIGFNNIQTRLVYSGNDIVPFNFFVINSELGSGSTFSSINMDQGVITRGDRGFVITGQTQAQRIDLEIPDEIFEIKLTNNGPERLCAQRDFINEWVYFTYPDKRNIYDFPTKTLLYNYRDNSWAVFRETYTTYGQFKRRTGFIWQNVGTIYQSWSSWNDPWDAGESTLLQPNIVGGNQQGFILIRDVGTDEANSLYIQGFTGNVVTSPNHCLNENDYIVISGVLGTTGQVVNGKIFSVFATTTNTFQLNPPISAGTYLGGGLIKRLYIPFIQTKQFPVAWGIGRKTKIGVQQYLLTTTQNSQIQLFMYLSQNASSPYNFGPIVPSASPDNSSLIYSTVLYTCPESTNLGLTPANINLNMVTAIDQAQIWHRKNTSLLGDTIQLGFTMSDEQMRTLAPSGTLSVITGASQTNPSVLDAINNFSPGQLITISGVVGMTQLNGKYFNVLSATPTTVTIEVNATGFSPYISGGVASAVGLSNQIAEIELHSFILDVTPSQLLA